MGGERGWVGVEGIEESLIKWEGGGDKFVFLS